MGLRRTCSIYISRGGRPARKPGGLLSSRPARLRSKRAASLSPRRARRLKQAAPLSPRHANRRVPVKAAPLVPGPRPRSRLCLSRKYKPSTYNPRDAAHGFFRRPAKDSSRIFRPPHRPHARQRGKLHATHQAAVQLPEKTACSGIPPLGFGEASGAKRNRHAGAHMRLLCVYRAGRSTARRDAVWP